MQTPVYTFESTVLSTDATVGGGAVGAWGKRPCKRGCQLDEVLCIHLTSIPGTDMLATPSTAAGATTATGASVRHQVGRQAENE